MIYRMMKQISGILIGALITLAVIWFAPNVNAFPATAPPAIPAVGPLLETVATTPALNYQGRLLDPVNGQAKADGAYAFTFRIYNTATGGAPLWTETKSVSVNKGLFSTLLGDTTPLDGAIFTGQDLYLGVTLGTDPEAAPRQRLAYVAYAMYAEKAGNANLLNGQGAGAFAPAAHTHSGEQINAGTVAEARIDGAITRDNEVMSIVNANSGSGSGLNADLLDGYDQSNFYKSATATQVNQTTPLAVGGQEYWYTFGYSADQLVVWRVKPTVVGAKMRLEVEIEMSANNTVTYWLRVYNTGTIASGYQLIRHHFVQ